jgi:hypothetical protein
MPFELHDGESTSLQWISLKSFSITATGGFHGSALNFHKTGDALQFVRDGSSSSEKASLGVRRTREPLNLLAAPGFLSALDPTPRTWTVNGIVFTYRRFAGEGAFADHRYAYVYASVGGGEYLTLELISPASMWPEAFAGLAALVASVRPIEKAR